MSVNSGSVNSGSVNSGFVNVEARDDSVTMLQLDRPPANALSRALLEELAATARALVTQPPKTIIITNDKHIFTAGTNITEFNKPKKTAVMSGHFREAL